MKVNPAILKWRKKLKRKGLSIPKAPKAPRKSSKPKKPKNFFE